MLGYGSSARAQAAVTFHPSHSVATADGEELSEAERATLREAVQAHLRLICDDDDAQVVTDFVGVLVEDRKSPAEMVSELTFFKEGASEFVAWVHKEIRRLLAKRPGRTTASAASASSRESGWRDLVRRQAARGARVVDEASSIDLTSERPMGSNLSAEEPGPGDTVNQRKKEMLAEYTKKLQVILGRLGGSPGQQALNENEREKYQKLASTIQAQMKALSLGTRA